MGAYGMICRNLLELRATCVTPPSEPLSCDHLLDDFSFVIDHKMRVALHHRERFVSKHVGDFKEGGTLSGQHRRRGVAQVVKMKVIDARRLERDVPVRVEMLIRARQPGRLWKYVFAARRVLQLQRAKSL